MEFEIIENEKIQVNLKENGKVVAKATCYLRNTPKYENKNTGTIGEFEAEEEKYGIKILKKCEEIFKKNNINYIVAPMNGNTWNKYRTLKYTNGDEMFLLENVNPIEQNEIFIKSGFKEICTYTSSKALLKNYYDAKSLERLEEKIKKENISIRRLNKDRFIEDLKEVYNIAIQSFNKNVLYTQISQKEFLQQYEKYKDFMEEDFFLIAEKGKKGIAFCFAIPDLKQLERGEKVDTVIVKTAGVIPKYNKYALGSIMVRNIAKTAIKKNYKKWISAFIYSGNTSNKMAKRNGAEKIREYALYGKEI